MGGEEPVAVQYGCLYEAMRGEGERGERIGGRGERRGERGEGRGERGEGGGRRRGRRGEERREKLKVNYGHVGRGIRVKT